MDTLHQLLLYRTKELWGTYKTLKLLPRNLLHCSYIFNLHYILTNMNSYESHSPLSLAIPTCLSFLSASLSIYFSASTCPQNSMPVRLTIYFLSVFLCASCLSFFRCLSLSSPPSTQHLYKISTKIMQSHSLLNTSTRSQLK